MQRFSQIRWGSGLIALLMCVAAAQQARVEATPVPFLFTGSVDTVFDGLGALDESVAPGTVIRGTYTIDTDTPNTALPPDQGEAGFYQHDSPPAGVLMALGNLRFHSHPANPDFTIIINNDVGTDPIDEYGFTSGNNQAEGLLPSAPIGRLDFDWLASTTDTSLFTSAALPITAPDLEVLGGGLLTIEGECVLCLGPAAFFRISATITSLSTANGDLNNDNRVESLDIDLLRQAILGSTTNPDLNLNGIGGDIPDEEDFDFLISNIIGTARGDVDLNRTINFDDFAVLSTNFNMLGANWDRGNVNIDNITNFADFVEISNHWGITLTSTEPIPEPSALLSLWCGLPACTHCGAGFQPARRL